MNRAVVNVATGPYVRGQQRLKASLPRGCDLVAWTDTMPPGSPSHLDVPYTFKAYAIKAAIERGYSTVLWADACILPVGSLLWKLWDKIESEGVWISRNGWSNAQWTADSAYADLGVTREENEKIEHVVATAFGLNVTHPTGKAIFKEYLRLAQTLAFCGPWWNRNAPEYADRAGAVTCGPPSTLGHRHDQTALSVIAWRAGVELTSPPQWFAYRGGESEQTALVADGQY